MKSRKRVKSRNIFNCLKDFWRFLKEDTWQSWIVSLILAFVFIKFIFFPVLSLVTGSPLPLVVVESCSMYHSTSDFDKWWEQNEEWYVNRDVGKEAFEDFIFKNGLNKGDIILVWGHGDYNVGDIVIFQSSFKYPLIHRIIENGNKIGTKGDNNVGQLSQEKDIMDNAILGKSVAKIPGLGWAKLIFFEAGRPESQRGFCE